MTAGSEPDWKDKVRSRCLRPVEPAEVPYLVALGAAVTEMRNAVGVSRTALACPDFSRTTLQRIELGLARTRRSTLTKVAATLVRLAAESGLDLGDPEEILAHWCSLAGPALAPESEYTDKIQGRREKRERLQARRERRKAELWAATQEQALELAHEMAWPLAQELAAKESARRSKLTDRQRAARRKKETELVQREVEIGHRELQLRIREGAVAARERQLDRHDPAVQVESAEAPPVQVPSAVKPTRRLPVPIDPAIPRTPQRTPFPRPPKTRSRPSWLSG